MTPDREECITRTLKHEGGFVDHPSDPGRATRYGVTQAVARENGYTGDMRKLPIEKAIQIYTDKYWHRYGCDKLPGIVAFQFFDACVNNGGRQATLWLQRAAGVADDGIIGPVTLGAVDDANPVAIATNLYARRLDFFTRLSTWDSFGKGWTRRMSDNARYLAKDASA